MAEALGRRRNCCWSCAYRCCRGNESWGAKKVEEKNPAVKSAAKQTMAKKILARKKKRKRQKRAAASVDWPSYARAEVATGETQRRKRRWQNQERVQLPLRYSLFGWRSAWHRVGASPFINCQTGKVPSGVERRKGQSLPSGASLFHGGLAHWMQTGAFFTRRAEFLLSLFTRRAPWFRSVTAYPASGGSALAPTFIDPV